MDGVWTCAKVMERGKWRKKGTAYDPKHVSKSSKHFMAWECMVATGTGSPFFMDGVTADRLVSVGQTWGGDWTEKVLQTLTATTLFKIILICPITFDTLKWGGYVQKNIVIPIWITGHECTRALKLTACALSWYSVSSCYSYLESNDSQSDFSNDNTHSLSVFSSYGRF